ncbi:MAG: TonB-dependent receptor plug domain-containing protein, partial [Gemmatimonadaceae bacterium]
MPSSTPDAGAPAVIGTVLDSAGAPLANAYVVVAEVGRTTSTNAAGVFVLRGLPPREYHLNVMLLGYAPGHAVVTVPPEGEDVLVTIRLVATPLRLTSIIVSASATGTEADRLTQAALELSGRALARSLGSSVASTLAGEPGVSQRYAGPAASMPVIRGLTGDRILVLQDGERSGDLAASASDHAVSVDPLAAQRIEVVRGPASLLYGNSALGGVVNVVSNDIPTVVPSHLEGQIGAQGESATPGGAISAGITAKAGARGAVSVRGGHRDMGALRTGGAVTLGGTDSRASNATVGYGFIGERGNVGVAVRLFDFNYGLPAEAGDPESGVRIDGRRVGVSARGGIQFGSVSLPYLRVEGTAQDYTHDEVEPDGEIGTTFKLRTQTANAQATTAFGRVKGAIGVQGLFKQYNATGEEALTPGANSTGIGVFLYQELPLGGSDAAEGGTQLQVGARWDGYGIASETGEAKFGPGRTVSFGNASGSLGLSVPVGTQVTVSGSVAGGG